LRTIRQSVIDFVDALGHGVDGRAMLGGDITQGALGSCLKIDAMNLLERVTRFKFKLEGYL